MDVSWDDMRLFLAAYEQGSLSGAAQACGLGQATLSRRIAGLEAQLGKRLFDRRRQGLEPTAAALALHPWAEQMAGAARQAAAELQGLESRPEGLVRVAVSPGLAVDVFPPILSTLYRRHPGLRIELLSDNLNRDIDRHEADIALRSFPPKTGDLLVRKLCDVDICVFASQAYVASLPAGVRAEDLDWITWSEELAHIPLATWVAERLGGRQPALTTNSFLAMRAAAAHGVGAVLMPEFQARLAGLVPVPVGMAKVMEAPVFLVVHRRLRRVPRVAAVIAFVEETVGAYVSGAAWPPAALADGVDALRRR